MATRVPLVILAAAIAATSILGQELFPSPLPAPTGPYAVGRTSFDWVDESRSDSATPHGHRELVVWLWYPRNAKVRRSDCGMAARQMGTTVLVTLCAKPS